MKDAATPNAQPIVGVIPARYGSLRLPGKPLAILGDRTLIHHVHDRASRCGELAKVVVATDDERILREVLAFGGTAIMTSAGLRSGTDRIAEALDALGERFDLAVNIQGDEPFVDPGAIGAVARALRSDPGAIWTAVAPFEGATSPADPNRVKAVLAGDGRVLYFSRAQVPHARDGRDPGGLLHHHQGIYGYARDLLMRFVATDPSPLEALESLEQLRAVEAGIPVRAVRVPAGFGGVDTVEDLERARRFLEDGGARGGSG